ncbi:hypothetical protein RB195_022441 [Necator americanus]|uniref:Uncharacterized protein n=1 Tax=Necator americanus TaxID=51031 RepID=A0ABR1EFC6_NECAM
MTHGRYQHLAPPSKVATENRLHFFGHIIRRRGDRLVQRVLRKYGIAANGLILCKLSQEIEKVGQSCVQGRHTSAKMRVIASDDDDSSPMKPNQADTCTTRYGDYLRLCSWNARTVSTDAELNTLLGAAERIKFYV